MNNFSRKIWYTIKTVSSENLLLLLLLFILPFQTRLRFPNKETMLFGNFNNYGVWEIYASDIVFICLFVVVLRKSFLKSNQHKKLSKNILTSDYWLLFFLLSLLIFAALSITQVFYVSVAYSRFLKLVELVLVIILFAYLIKPKNNSYSSNTSIHLSTSYQQRTTTVILLSSSIQSLLAIVQFLLQRSPLFSLLRIIGQPNLDLQEPGISFILLRGHRFMRAYGTFPHPNVLAIYLLLVIPLFFLINLRKTGWYYLALVLNLVALFLTFSRLAWIWAGVLAIVLLWQKRTLLYTICTQKIKKCMPVIFLGTLLCLPFIFSIVFYRFYSLFTDNSITISERWLLNLAAWNMITKHPLLGVGLGNFVLVLRDYDFWGISLRYQQPVHNLFLLIAAEIGLGGFFSFLALLGVSIFNLLKKLTIATRLWQYVILSLVTIVLVAQFDHYFWDIQQGILLLGIIVGLANNKNLV